MGFTIFRGLCGINAMALVAAFLFAAAGLVVSGCETRSDNPPSVEVSPTTQAPQQGTIDPAVSQKINPHILRLLDKLRVDGVTEANRTKSNFAGYSNQLIRIDDEGNIQSYIKVTEITPAIYQTLSKYDIHVELANEQLKIIQAEIPFYHVKDLAVADFVTRIDPPSYGRTRGPLSTGGGTP